MAIRVFTDPAVTALWHSLSFSSSATQRSPSPIEKRALPDLPAMSARNPMGRCLMLLMALIVRPAAVGGLMALVVQLSGPTPLRAVVSDSVQMAVRSVVEQPVHATAAATAQRAIQVRPSSLPHLQIPPCHDAVCAGR